MIRPDLDGLLIGDEERSRVFLVYEGRRHQIATDEVLQALFEARPVEPMDLSAIDEGYALHNGTCLTRGEVNGPIYMLAIRGDVAKRHLIRDYESFKEFGFALERVVHIPTAVLALVPDGCELTGARARVGRW